MKKLNILLLIMMLLHFFPGLGLANVTELVMPGPLIEGHARIESDCNKCHSLLANRQQRDLCLNCHKLVAADIGAKRGFHGRNSAVGEKECRDCHTDHEGRKADILLLDEETFDHLNTDFVLQGAHQKVACHKCHTPELVKAELRESQKLTEAALNKHRNAPDRCFDCHQKTEPHNGALGKDCQNCHRADGWSQVTFKHETTKFKLEGAHKEVACNQCHPNQRWQEVPQDCFSCHRLNDHHAGRYGEKCGDCHSPQSARQDSKGKQQSAWKTTVFDHGRTGFPLLDKHSKVACELCHTSSLQEQKLSKTCVSCHQADAPHRGRFGEKCHDCHQPTAWKKATYDHTQTKFPLQGKHAEVDCYKCHTGPAEGQDLQLDCYSCHQLDDPHNGQQGEDCASCHSPDGWQEEVLFDHDLSKFPLIGMHAVVPCEACHVESSFQDTKSDCVACHQKDDEHQQKLGQDCARCHNPNGWNLWLFDHNTQSKFKLDGKHASLSCLACHNTPKKKLGTDKSCVSCHKKDEPHDGAFGRNCERCHTTIGFDQPLVTQ